MRLVLPPPPRWFWSLSYSEVKMSANQDYKELFSILNAEKVEYLIAGAHAVIFYTEPRYTKDLHIWVNPTKKNAERVYAALKKFGAPLIDINAENFAEPDLIYQIGIAPNRIDIIMGLVGLDFASAWNHRVESTYDGIPIYILSKEDLILTKRATGRPQDLLDVDKLKS